MGLTFQGVATVTAALGLLLSAAWVFVPHLYLALWQVPYSEPVGVVMRRGGVLFFAFACIFFLARRAPASPARSALCRGTVAGLLALAIQAGYEFLAGHAGPLVLAALAVEVALAGAFVMVLRNESRDGGGDGGRGD